MTTSENNPAKLPPAGDAQTLYVIDISGYVFRAYHALPPLQSPKGEPTHAVLGVTTMLLKLVQEQKPALLAVAMDSRTKSFRHKLYDQYKANRPPPPPDLSQQMARVREIVEAYAIPVLQQDGVEADDMIASLVRAAREHGLSVVIVSADKDLLQLVGHDVLMYDTGRNLVFGEQETRAKLGVPPGLVRDYLALVGDSSDNVPGVPSVGPKTAVQLLTDHGTLEALYAQLDTVKKPALRQKLEDHREQAMLSRDLVTLHDDLGVKIDVDALAWSGADLARLRALFVELGFTRLVRDLPAVAGAEPSGTQPQAVVAPGAPQPTAAGAECTVVNDLAALDQLIAQLRASSRCTLVSVLDDSHAARAGLVGLLLASDAGHAAYVPLAHTYLGHPEQLPAAQVFERLRPLLEAARPSKLCVDTKRDAIALAGHGIALCGVEMDLMLASYLVDAERHGHSLRELSAELGERDLTQAQVLLAGHGDGELRAPELEISQACKLGGDVLAVAAIAAADLQRRLAALGCQALLTDMEIPLALVLADVERTGVRVDVQQLSRLSTQVAGQLVELEAKCRKLAGRDFNVGSPRQLEAILFDELSLPVIKRTKTARSTDHDVLEELALHHELPAAILEHRMLAKLKNTYLDALPREIDPRSGRIHSEFRQAVAATGRLSSTNPNLQNIPIRSELGRQIRHAFVAREGWEIFSADYSQIELRVLAHLSHDPQLVEAFATGQDVHIRTARAIFGGRDEDVTREMRAQAKTVNFAVIYGQTQFALARNLRIDRAEAGRYIKAFFEQYAGVKRYMDEVVEQARQSGATRTLLGRVRNLPDLRIDNRQKREAAERVARNTPIQGTAADIIKLAMISIHRGMQEQKLESKMLLTVHDELVFEAPPSERAALEALVVERMQHAIKLDVPLLVDKGWGKSWGEAH
ncbi:MAG TPA: DNA polymerase I [Polyangiales bacterium]